MQTQSQYEEDLSGIQEWARQIVWNLQKDMTFWDHVTAFVHAVDWNETWILALIALQLLLFGFTVYTQQNWAIQSVLFIMTFIIVNRAQWINEWCGNNWQSFSNQNYFDPSGLFVTVILSLPLCLISLVALVLALYNTSRLVIQVKALEFKQQLRQKHKNAKDKQNKKELKKTK